MPHMRNMFASYHSKTANDIYELWKNSLITFDTNFLLGLYRYSSDSRAFIRDLMFKLKDRVFITHQVGLEFHRNRYRLISELAKSHLNAKNNVDKVWQELLSNSAFPHIPNEVKSQLSAALHNTQGWIKKGKDEYESLIKNDTVLEQIYEAIGDTVENGYDNKRMQEILIEGKKRYESDIPPGYKDKQKTDNKYGDFIIWKQMIDKAKSTGKSIIFVTNEKKEDWWWKIEPMAITIGPRHELIEEMITETGLNFHITSFKGFVKSASELFEIDINHRALTEIIRTVNAFNFSLRDSYTKIESVAKIVNIIVDDYNGIGIDAQRINSFIESLGYQPNVLEMKYSSTRHIYKYYALGTNNIHLLKQNIESWGYNVTITIESNQKS